MSEVQPIKLGEKTRATLADLYRASQQAQKEFQQAIVLTVDLLGLDPAGNHTIDFEKGIITPASTATGPTLVKEEAG